MFIVMERRTAGVLFFGIFFLGIGLGFYNFALHPNMFNWEKEGILIREVRTDQKVIALTFDDGPDPVNTKALLEVLEKYKIQATFFVLGKRAEKHPELLKKMVEAGHEIANHSYSHADFNGKSDEYGEKCNF
jgi:peptidoglycan/xylan/chitin deacetylase (PgdA/CDA1 family)